MRNPKPTTQPISRRPIPLVAPAVICIKDSPWWLADIPDVLSSLRARDRSNANGLGPVDDGSPTSGVAACAPGPQEDRIQRALYAGNLALAVDIALEVWRHSIGPFTLWVVDEMHLSHRFCFASFVT